MGIFIHLNISDTITEDEWERAYQKSVKLMEKMPFIEKTVKGYHGTSLVCTTKTVEKEWYGKYGWHTIGDSVSMKTAEDYFLPKNIIVTEKTDESVKLYVDPYMSILPAYSNFDFEDERCARVICLWGNKTQAEPYHFYLLAVACMLEHELPGKVAIYGDITRGQCKKAVEIASDLLGEQIELPDRCDLQGLHERVKKMPLKKNEVVDAFTVLYLGNQNEEFGEFIRKGFTDEELKLFWSGQFSYSKIGTYGFSDWLKKYLLWGFQVANLKEYVRFEDEEGNDLAEKFVKAVLDTEVFLEEKDCEDILEIDREEEGSYSIYTLLAHFAFAGAKNHRVNRYIPPEVLLAELEKCVGGLCDVSQIVTEYMAEHTKRDVAKNPTNAFISHMHQLRDELTSAREEYDISDSNELLWFESGNSIAPSLNNSLMRFFEFYRETIQEDKYHELLKQGPIHAVRYLIRQNRYLLFMEEAWDRIINNIENNIDAFERYYPMVRVEPTKNDLVHFIRALVLNDELYQYCMDRLSNTCDTTAEDVTNQTIQ